MKTLAFILLASLCLYYPVVPAVVAWGALMFCGWVVVRVFGI